MQVKSMYAVAGCLAAMIALGGLSWLVVSESPGQEPEPNSNERANSNASAVDGQAQFPGGYMGSTDCLACHKGQIRKQGFVRLIEPKIWETDPHSKAFEFIDWHESAETASRKLSREICKNLDIKDVHQAQQCLSCHANWVAGLAEKPPFYADGVGCESCHGPGLQWELLHRQPNWRTVSAADKAAKKMIDVRHPVRRAEQCFSCHIGNVAEGKVISHEMYAAGHPPLPSIEIESFAKQMPRHWRYLKEKTADSRRLAADENGDAPPFEFYREFVQQNHGYLKADDPGQLLEVVQRHKHGAAAVVLGGVVALRQAIELTRDLASTSAGRNWPELSAFDCTACHHDLKQAEFRQTGTRALRPGRPTMHAWPIALVRLAIYHVSVDLADFERRYSAFARQLATLQDSFVATPFGDPAELQQVATALSQWLTDELITPVAEKPFDNAAVRLACLRLAYMASADEEGHDFDSARQIAWALRTLYCELDEKPSRDPQIQVLFQELATDLRLDLPNSSGEFCETVAPATPSSETPSHDPVALTNNVPASLAAEVNFDSARFKKTMGGIRSLLK